MPTKKKKNYGKIFEQDFQNSVDTSKMIVEREKDNVAFQSRSKNPYDFRIYLKPNIFFFELKSTGGASININNSIIKDHQIEELTHRGKYPGAYAGFLFQFRERDLKTKHREHMIYYLAIENFNKRNKKKKSLSPEEIKSLGGIRVEAHKKITRYTLNINKLILDIQRGQQKRRGA